MVSVPMSVHADDRRMLGAEQVVKVIGQTSSSSQPRGREQRKSIAKAFTPWLAPIFLMKDLPLGQAWGLLIP